MLPEAQELLARFDALPQVVRNGEHNPDAASGKIIANLDSTLPETMMHTLSERQRINPLFNHIPLNREPMVLAYVGEKELPLEEPLERRELLLLEGEDRWNMVLREES